MLWPQAGPPLRPNERFTWNGNIRGLVNEHFSNLSVHHPILLTTPMGTPSPFQLAESSLKETYCSLLFPLALLKNEKGRRVE